MSPTFADTSPVPSAGPSVESLPFAPPTNWVRIPTNFLHPLLTWGRKATSSFAINRIDVPITPDYFEQFIAAQSKALGSVVDSSGASICGAPAYRATIRLSSAPELMTTQIQSIDGAVYYSTYLHPEASASDTAILNVLSTFCGEKSLANAAPPGDWRTTDAKVIGTWVAQGETMTLVASKAATEAESAARDAAFKAFQGSSTEILSKSTTTFCGIPATIVIARAQPPVGPKIDVTMEITQSGDTSYTLIYGHPAYIVSDDAAKASLASLCASGTPSAPASPAPASPS